MLLTVLGLGLMSFLVVASMAPAHFNGNYALAAAGGAAGGGGGVAALKNQNGVEMVLTATAQGVRFSLVQAGVNVKLKK